MAETDNNAEAKPKKIVTFRKVTLGVPYNTAVQGQQLALVQEMHGSDPEDRFLVYPGSTVALAGSLSAYDTISLLVASERGEKLESLEKWLRRKNVLEYDEKKTFLRFTVPNFGNFVADRSPVHLVLSSGSNKNIRPALISQGVLYVTKKPDTKQSFQQAQNDELQTASTPGLLIPESLRNTNQVVGSTTGTGGTIQAGTASGSVSPSGQSGQTSAIQDISFTTEEGEAGGGVVMEMLEAPAFGAESEEFTELLGRASQLTTESVQVPIQTTQVSGQAFSGRVVAEVGVENVRETGASGAVTEATISGQVENRASGQVSGNVSTQVTQEISGKVSQAGTAVSSMSGSATVQSGANPTRTTQGGVVRGQQETNVSVSGGSTGGGVSGQVRQGGKVESETKISGQVGGESSQISEKTSGASTVQAQSQTGAAGSIQTGGNAQVSAQAATEVPVGASQVGEVQSDGPRNATTQITQKGKGFASGKGSGALGAGLSSVAVAEPPASVQQEVKEKGETSGAPGGGMVGGELGEQPAQEDDLSITKDKLRRPKPSELNAELNDIDVATNQPDFVKKLNEGEKDFEAKLRGVKIPGSLAKTGSRASGPAAKQGRGNAAPAQRPTLPNGDLSAPVQPPKSVLPGSIDGASPLSRPREDAVPSEDQGGVIQEGGSEKPGVPSAEAQGSPTSPAMPPGGPKAPAAPGKPSKPAQEQEAEQQAQEQEQQQAQQLQEESAEKVLSSEKLQKEIEAIASTVNELLDTQLLEGVGWVWMAAIPSVGLSILIGAIIGDLLWMFKNMIIRRILGPVLQTKPPQVQQAGEQIMQKIKISNKVKLNIVGWNIIILVIAALVFMLIFFIIYAACNNFAGQATQVLGVDYGVCSQINSLVGQIKQ